MKPRPRISPATTPRLTPLIALLALFILLVCLATVSAGEPAGASSDAPAASSGDAISGQKDILDMDVEQLSKVDVKVPSMDVEVTSVAKHESTIGRSPAAVFVITQEMIRRSGATTIPDLLRMVPGMDVAQIDSHSWSVSARGFNGRFAQRLLVLIDGRSVYNELYGGVFWDVQDTVLEDIDRIEVIRGPGGTLWGDNAVNGVVNIITKKAQDTQGTLVTAGGGNWDRLNDAVRVGGNNGDGLYWRLYGKHFDRAPEWAAGGANDSWRQGRGGFRIDWDADRYDVDRLTLQGDYYSGNESQNFNLPVPYDPFSVPLVDDVGASGANVLARWSHRLGEKSDWMLQTYFDGIYREEVAGRAVLNTFDVEFQHRFPLAPRHDLTWGLDSRQVHSHVPTDTFYLRLSPVDRTTNLFSGFVQDEITLVDDRLFFTIGTKLEHNSFSGFEYQPSARLLWSWDKKHALWGAVSRAVRTPTLLEEDATAHLGPFYDVLPLPTFLEVTGSRDLRAEPMMAYEIGYRAQTTDTFSWDLALYCNVYEDLIWGIQEWPDLKDGYFIVPFPQVNGWRAHTYGLELHGQWAISQAWRVSAWYNTARAHFQNTVGTEDIYTSECPLNQAQLHSSWDLGSNWEFDLGLRYVDTSPDQAAPEYLTMDLRLGWRPNKNWELALVGRNLLDDHHFEEYSSPGYGYVSTEVRRTVFAVVTLRR